MTPTDVARSAAEKLHKWLCYGSRNFRYASVDELCEFVTPLLAERDATIDAMEKTVVELQRQVDELKLECSELTLEYSELEAAIERHY